ncbi:MAG: amino acid ABC transporter substrate-binding protein [Candidatus Taylorbacteria bacterium]|nr:amino acid ABC transporter substrate-binding protein [Candidatus Taylorbacteria bacterium]
MKKKYIFLIILVVIAISLFEYTGNTKKEFVIGAIIPESGFGAYWGIPVRSGINLAMQDLKAEYGDSFKLIIEDSQGNPKIAASAASKLLNVHNASALYTEFSGVSSAVSPIAKESGSFLVYSTFNQKILENNPYSVKTFMSYDVVCDEFAKNIPPGSTVHIVSAISDAAPYCKKSLMKYLSEANIKITEGISGTDFRTLLLQQKQDRYDYLIPIMYEDGYFAYIKQKGELQIPGIIFCYKDDCYTEKIKKGIASKDLSGMFIFSVAIDSLFKEKILRHNPSMTELEIAASANSYQSVYMIGEALYKCKKDIDCIQKELNHVSLSNPGYENARIENRALQSKIVIQRVQ